MFSTLCELSELAHRLPLESNVRTERLKSSRGFDVGSIFVVLADRSFELVGGCFPGDGPDECRDDRGGIVCVYRVAVAHGCACAGTAVGGCAFDLVKIKRESRSSLDAALKSVRTHRKQGFCAWAFGAQQCCARTQ